jgi:hypothetical protein
MSEQFDPRFPEGKEHAPVIHSGMEPELADSNDPQIPPPFNVALGIHPPEGYQKPVPAAPEQPAPEGQAPEAQ